MATYRVFINDNDVQDKAIGKNSSYSYIDGELRVYRRDKLVWIQSAEKGDSFIIMCYNGKTIVKDMIAPKKNGDLVSWLLGFTKHNRAHFDWEYVEIKKEYRRRYSWDGYAEWHYAGDNYEFIRCNRPWEDGYHNVAAYISDSITKQEVLNLISLMVFPSEYTVRILGERFGITEEEYNGAKLRGIMRV